MLRLAPLVAYLLARLRRPLTALMILPCLSIPNFTEDEFHVEGKALRSWIWDLHCSDWAKQVKACHVLEAQGERARAAVPALIALLHDKEAILRHCAIDALGGIGTPPDVLAPALLPCLEDKVSLVRSSAERTLLDLLLKWEQTVDVRDLTPILLHLLLAPYAPLRMEAAVALSDIHADPQIVVPAFLNGLQDEAPLVRGNCVIMLSKMGEDARPHLPAIRKLMRSDPSGLVRVQAAITVWRLDKDAESTVPVLLAQIDKDELTLDAALLGLVELGPAARPAVPVLRARLPEEDRPFIRTKIERALTALEKD